MSITVAAILHSALSFVSGARRTPITSAWQLRRSGGWRGTYLPGMSIGGCRYAIGSHAVGHARAAGCDQAADARRRRGSRSQASSKLVNQTSGLSPLVGGILAASWGSSSRSAAGSCRVGASTLGRECWRQGGAAAKAELGPWRHLRECPRLPRSSGDPGSQPAWAAWTAVCELRLARRSLCALSPSVNMEAPRWWARYLRRNRERERERGRSCSGCGRGHEPDGCLGRLAADADDIPDSTRRR